MRVKGHCVFAVTWLCLIGCLFHRVPARAVLEFGPAVIHKTYFHNRAIIFADLFTIMAAASLITLIASCLARGKRRGAGVVFSIATFVFVIIIFATNQ